MQNQFRLDNLLARDVGPEWFEGVAIVQLVCRQLRAEGRESAFPHPENILIGVGGSITITGYSDANPVQTAAHVLGLMLGNDVPVRLRLAVSQATAADGGFASLAEFSEALAYFERPNPEGIIEAFRQRAVLASPRDIAPAVRVDAAPAPEKKPISTPPVPRRHVSPVAVGLATFAVLVGASAWMNRAKLADLLTPTVAGAESAESAAPTARSSTKSATTVASVQHHNNTVSAGPTTRVTPSIRAARTILPAPPELQVVATTLSFRYPTTLPSESVVELPELTEPVVVAFRDVHTLATEDRIYSQADPQVTVPLSVYPKFPNDPPAASSPRGTTLELTIAADGLVERVRMLTVPRNIHEFMLLSAAKAWRFEPARIDGHPVRFRKLMTLTAIP
jgi:hypothetical protein